ncbi:MAG: cytochrome c [Deltaproteobacteria bacterium]|nr:cytochrome c [Deltaproteobacteria bacterium]
MRRPALPRLALPLPLLAAVVAVIFSCKGAPDEGPWCGDAQVTPPPVAGVVTWHRDVAPTVAQKCGRCHETGGIAPHSFASYDEAASLAPLLRKVVAERSMPPFLAASCCSEYAHGYSLTEAELATLLAWTDGEKLEGDPGSAPPPKPALGGLSRVDLVAEMPEAYTPAPDAGSTDDLRCFVLDVPFERAVYVTGLEPLVGNRELVHHLVVGLVGPEQASAVAALDAKDPRPGFDCRGGFGDLDDVRVLGGSLLGGDFRRDLGVRVEPGSKLVLNLHYSTVKTSGVILPSSSPGSDRTALAMRTSDTAREAKVMAIFNPLWIAGSAFEVDAGDPDAAFFYRFVPELFTQGKPIALENVTPHMHDLGRRIGLKVRRADGTRSCLLDIPRWEFGWEQPYWFAEPKRIEPDDELYLECRYDNSAANQLGGGAPREFVWGRDMCAAFLLYTELEP